MNPAVRRQATPRHRAAGSVWARHHTLLRAIEPALGTTADPGKRVSAPGASSLLGPPTGATLLPSASMDPHPVHGEPLAQPCNGEHGGRVVKPAGPAREIRNHDRFRNTVPAHNGSHGHVARQFGGVHPACQRGERETRHPDFHTLAHRAVHRRRGSDRTHPQAVKNDFPRFSVRKRLPDESPALSDWWRILQTGPSREPEIPVEMYRRRTIKFPRFSVAQCDNGRWMPRPFL